MRRHGVAYTIASLVLLAVIAAVYLGELRVGERELQAAAADRIRGIDAFIHNIDQDSKRAAYIAGFRALIAMEQHVTSTGEYIDDPDSAFLEIFMTGAYDGQNFTVMENSTFGHYLERVQVDAGRQGISFQTAVTNTSTWQTDPWTVLVNYTIAMNVTDIRGTANWTLTRTFMGSIPIVDLKDPLFTAQTLGRVQRVIRPTNVTVFVNDVGNANDTSGLVYHHNNSLYRALGRGPSIMMRFAGNMGDSPWGIESLVDIEDLDAQGLPVDTSLGVIDWKYFDAQPATVCDIQNLTDTIRLDHDDIGYYEIEGKLTYGSC